MSQSKPDQTMTEKYTYRKRKAIVDNERIKIYRFILPIVLIIAIVAILTTYSHVQRANVINNAEQVANQMAEYIAGSIVNEIDYAKSSIKFSAVSIAQTMTSENLENPLEVISPMLVNTPFGGIEYIRADGMNVMNIGEPFDASDRVYYVEGIKGNTGVWNNYHPKTSMDTLMNFYTPLIYQGKKVGVLTGYIEANRQLAPLFVKQLYGQDVYGFLVDENDMIICSTLESDYIADFTLDMFIERFNVTDDNRAKVKDIINKATDVAQAYKDPANEGRICVVAIPETGWKVAIIVPYTSIKAIAGENTTNSIFIIAVISLILVSYASFVLIRNVRARKNIAKKNALLEEENRAYNEENQRAFAEISEIRDIIASAVMGTWRIELVEGKEPKMYADKVMKSLLGIDDSERTPEKVYSDWFSHIKAEAVDSVISSVERMKNGYFDENTYLWNHPTKGERYVRCGGTAQEIPGGYVLSGYHYDVDDVVREDQAKVVMLQGALDEKNEYYSTLESLSGIFYSMHVIDLVEDSVVEFNAKNKVKEIVNHKQGAREMMKQIMSATTTDEYKADALEFTDLDTLADRIKNKKMISKQLLGMNIGWILASFIAADRDEQGRVTKVIYTTRSIDEEKKQEERLIRNSQTDELTGLLNRRAYEEDVIELNNNPKTEGFAFVSLDVNGLKVINDSLGHAAGDELIKGSAYCMKKCLGQYGKIYRVGGDEFVAFLFCDGGRIGEIFNDFDETMDEWSGELVDGLSISYGWVSSEEMPELSVGELGNIADQRMYEAKTAHYKKTGVDRKGQQAAHKALCKLYTKILKINITEDSYQIVNMDVSEQSEEKGFSEKISYWLKEFGKTGNVHPDDLDSYLELTDLQYMKEYFANNKTSLSIFYRRKYETGFKQVMMEMIPANDYSEDNQSLFLYVKDIDK